MKRIAIMVQNIIQWYTIQPLAELLINQKHIPTDIIIYDPSNNDQGYHEIAKSLKTHIEQDGFKAKSSPLKGGYHITFAPYSNMITFPSKYRLGYSYSPGNTKPSITLHPDFKKGFHGIFAHNTYDAEIFSIYAHTYLVPYLSLEPIRYKKPSIKPTILFLPTYHEPSTIKTASSLMKLKDSYHIIAKKHHGIDHLAEEDKTRQILEQLADELYDSSQRIMPLYKKADLVLTDNSGASMDALYAKVPVAIAAPTINDGFHGVNALQYQLIQDHTIPYADSLAPSNLDRIIRLTLSSQQQKLQSDRSDKLFPNKTGGAKTWFKIIEYYLNDDIDQNYCIMHNYLEHTFTNLENENAYLQFLKTENQSLNAEITAIRNKLSLYENSRAHRALEKLLKFKR